MDYVSTITSKGQVTIPAAIRKAVGLKAKDQLAIRLEDQSIHLEPAKSSVAAGYGAVKLQGLVKDLKRLRRETRGWVAERASPLAHTTPHGSDTAGRARLCR